MYKDKLEPKIEVACAGCGRTQSVRKTKVTPCNGYTCTLGSCKLNPNFKPSQAPLGYILVTVFNAAGSFYGWQYRPETKEDKEAVERAKAIRDAGIKQLSNERVMKLLDF